MPTCPVVARLLLKDKKARVVRKIPFTIKLNYKSEEYLQDTTLGVDPGNKVLGTAVRVEGTNKVLYASEVKLRNTITSKLTKRASYRRNRRNRKTRYREARFLNRKSKSRQNNWLPPSIKSKVDSTKKEIRFIFSILPIRRVVFEYSKFDIHKMSDQKVWGFWYQKGPRFQFENTRSYVLVRDKYKCQSCMGKSKDKYLEVHHIKFRSEQGTDKPTNLLTLCSTCHKQVHEGTIKLTTKQLKVCLNTKDATQVSIISKRIWEWLKNNVKRKVFDLYKTFGFVTKVKRVLLNISKDHYLDAVACTYPKKEHYRKGLRKPNVHNFYTKICVSTGDYRQTMGNRSQIKIPTGKLQGFRKFDTVKFLGKIYAIYGRKSKGYTYLMDKFGKDLKIRPMPKFIQLERIQARSSQLVFSSTV